MSACTDAINARIESKQAYDTWKSVTESSLDSGSISNLQADIFDTANCLNDKIRSISTLSTTDSNTQLQIESLQKQIDDEKKNLEIANQRVNSVKHKENSYYESWFPMERDIRPRSNAILLGLSVALCFVSVAYILQLMNVYIFVKYIGLSPTGIDLSFMLNQFTISFWILLVILISVVLYFVYR
jgi:hypothetical protein